MAIMRKRQDLTPLPKEALDKWGKFIEELVSLEDKSYHTSNLTKDVT